MYQALLMLALPAALALRWVAVIVLGLVALIRADNGSVPKVADNLARWFRRPVLRVNIHSDQRKRR